MERVGSKIYRDLSLFVFILLSVLWLVDFFYSGNYPESIYRYAEFWLLFVIFPVIYAFIIWLKYSDRQAISRKWAKKKKFENDFKAVARSIEVNFEDCEVKHKEYFKEVIVDKGKKYESRENIRFSECRILYIYEEKGVATIFKTPTLYIELTNLHMELYQQKNTQLYIDNIGNKQFVDEKGRTFYTDNGSPYYLFDLNFLEDEVFRSPDPTTISPYY